MIRKSISSKAELETYFDSVNNPVENIYQDGQMEESLTYSIRKQKQIPSPLNRPKSMKRVIFKENFKEIIYIKSYKTVTTDEPKKEYNCIVRLFNKILCIE